MNPLTEEMTNSTLCTGREQQTQTMSSCLLCFLPSLFPARLSEIRAGKAFVGPVVSRAGPVTPPTSPVFQDYGE